MLSFIEQVSGGYYLDDTAEVGEGSKIGSETKIWSNAKIFSNVDIGKNCVIGAGVHIEGDVKLGDSCKVQRGVTLYRGVRAGDYVFFGPNATTTNDRNPRAFGKWQIAPTLIETGASIGANATLIAGNRIGSLSLVGAGAVVTRDVRPGELVVGNPARFAGWVNLVGEVISRDPNNTPEETKSMLVEPRLAIEEYLNREGELCKG